jgi:hypothetical protein
MIYFLYSARIYDISTLGAAISVTSIPVDQFTPVGGILYCTYYTASSDYIMYN